MNEVLSLLKTWCDRLLTLQNTSITDPGLYGAVLCPACASVHGRFSDALYPMICLYRHTGKEEYLRFSELAVEWTEKNLLRPDGSYYNDNSNTWKSITVFSAMGIAHTLLHHKDVLPPAFADTLHAIFLRQLRFLRAYFTAPSFRANINYAAAYPALLALAWKLLGDPSLREEALSYAQTLLPYFSEDGLLLGEGQPWNHRTKQGCGHVDIGYNVEESLPSLLEAACLLNDAALLSFFENRMRDHLRLMLPDGGWDNSFGTRANKWTYYGSRTSDGCQSGLALVASHDPLFAEAAWRNFELYQRCTHDGILYGGPMQHASGEPPCIHHGFTHAKALAAMVDAGFLSPPSTRVPLPRQQAQGLTKLPSAGVALAAVGPWRATINASGVAYIYGAAASGGTLSLLWHEKTGPLLVSSVFVYKPSEPTNMQYLRLSDEHLCTTPRIQLGDFSSANELNVSFSARMKDGAATANSSGNLKNVAFEAGPAYSLSLTVDADCVTIRASCEENAQFHLPLCCMPDEHLEKTTDGYVLCRASGNVYIQASNAAEGASGYQQTCGFHVRELLCPIPSKKEIIIRLHVH